MKINIRHYKKIKEAVNLAEKNCRARCTNYDEIDHAINQIENRLESLLYKKDWKGLRFLIDTNAQTFPGNYRGIPESTQVIIERFQSGWFLVSISRDKTLSSEINPLNLELKEKELVNFITDNFT